MRNGCNYRIIQKSKDSTDCVFFDSKIGPKVHFSLLPSAAVDDACLPIRHRE